MSSKETNSLLNNMPERFDGPDVILAAGDIKDICSALQATLESLEDTVLHPYGRLSLFEEHTSSGYFKGWLLQTPVINDVDVALMVHSTNTERIHLLSAWEYAPHAKVQLPESHKPTIIPHVRENYSIRERPNNRFFAEEYSSIENMEIFTENNPQIDTNPQKEFENIIEDYSLFTLYGLYKVNKLMRLLRADDVLA